MQKKGVVSSIPALKNADNHWGLLANEKANLFAETFSGKYGFRTEETNEYTPLNSRSCAAQMTIKTLEETDAKEVMEKLNLPHKFYATGDDIADAYPALEGCRGKPYSGVCEDTAGHIRASKGKFVLTENVQA